ncbi:MAG: hypothetical protein KatS3mg096_375 [Candidatus Parcubacteria bacterium]|nr:MAG: hypothetical protein KatS3mg096_375 [Candidatus Parcubacteria bacterium]
MSIYERDYYKERDKKIEKKSKSNYFVWALIIILILSIILSSLRF